MYVHPCTIRIIIVEVGAFSGMEIVDAAEYVEILGMTFQENTKHLWVNIQNPMAFSPISLKTILREICYGNNCPELWARVLDTCHCWYHHKSWWILHIQALSEQWHYTRPQPTVLWSAYFRGRERKISAGAQFCILDWKEWGEGVVGVWGVIRTCDDVRQASWWCSVWPVHPPGQSVSQSRENCENILVI